MVKVNILGGGISGITTGVVLQIMGYDTVIWTEKRADKVSVSRAEPEFSTAWPAGAIYPVTVDHRNLGEFFNRSQEFFRLFWKLGVYGVRRQSFNFISEKELQKPEFADCLDNFNHVEEPEFQRQSFGSEGFEFDMFFAEMPIYMDRIYALYQKLGGEINTARLEREEFLDKKGLHVNCTGYYSRQLFNDEKLRAIKGHLVHAKCPIPETANGRVKSYFYEPDMSEDHPGVYCFPRNDAVIFGGSHLEGSPEVHGEWHGEEPQQTVEIDGIDLPERIIEVNSELMGFDIRDNIQGVYTGYRPYREPIRIEKEHYSGIEVIHNYGHGGAGVTLSWSSAIEVAKKIGKERSKSSSETSEYLKQSIRKYI